jgi:hypothetical protein
MMFRELINFLQWLFESPEAEAERLQPGPQAREPQCPYCGAKGIDAYDCTICFGEYAE